MDLTGKLRCPCVSRRRVRARGRSFRSSRRMTVCCREPWSGPPVEWKGRSVVEKRFADLHRRDVALRALALDDERSVDGYGADAAAVRAGSPSTRPSCGCGSPKPDPPSTSSGSPRGSGTGRTDPLSPQGDPRILAVNWTNDPVKPPGARCLALRECADGMGGTQAVG